MRLILKVLTFFGFNISIDINKQICFRTSFNKAIHKVDDICYKFLQQIDKGFSVIDCIYSVNQKLSGLYNYYAVHSNEYWLYLVYDYTIQSIKDILYCDEGTRQMSLKSVNLLLELVPISKPPSSLIVL